MESFSSMLTVLVVSLALLQRIDGVAGDSVSCAGSALCKFSVSQSDCNAAQRQIVPGNIYFTDGKAGPTGTCSGTCGLFVQGIRCSLTGQQMLDDFNALRLNNCQKCGIYTYSNGCQFKMDYVTGCR